MAAAYSMDLRTRGPNDAHWGLSSKDLAERYHVSRSAHQQDVEDEHTVFLKMIIPS